jgi:epoxyqueuosine reductase QueG
MTTENKTATKNQHEREKIRKLILSLGANVCGFAHIDRFENAPVGFSPKDIFPACRTVIAFGVALPKGLLHINPRLVYGHYNHFSTLVTDNITFFAAKQIEAEFHCAAVPFPCDDPYEYWDADEMEGRGLISIKHIAVVAGLGTVGKSSLLLNQQFGNRLTLGAILTDLELSSDEFSQNLCLKDCRLCIDNCPCGAIGNNGKVNQKLCRTNTYNRTKRGFSTVDCNRCRTVCPVDAIFNL